MMINKTKHKIKLNKTENVKFYIKINICEYYNLFICIIYIN
jgi:hypothetical protein